MKINKINNMVDLNDTKDVELQSCWDDCKQYYAKSKSTYTFLNKSGCKVNGDATVAEIREIKEIYGCYCYRLKTPKTCIYW